MLIRRNDYLLLAPEGDEPTPGGGGAQPAASSDDDSEAPDPVVDDFIAAGTKPEVKPGEESPAPAVKPGEQPPAPAALPAAPKPGEQPAPKPPEPKPPVATPPAQPPAAAPAKPEAPAAPPVPPAPAAQPPATPAPEAPKPPETPPAPPQPSVEEQEKARKEQRAAYVTQLEKQYQIPKEDHDSLMTSPETVLPKLAAEVHTRAVEAAIAAVMSNIEPLVHAAIERRTVWKRSEEEFFSKWPKLNSGEARPVVERLMANYVQLNKGATRDQIMNDVGLMAMAHLRIPLDIPGAPGSETPPAPQPAFAPPAPPAAPGGGGMPQPARKPTAWDTVDQELFGDDK